MPCKYSGLFRKDHIRLGRLQGMWKRIGSALAIFIGADMSPRYAAMDYVICELGDQLAR